MAMVDFFIYFISCLLQSNIFVLTYKGNFYIKSKKVRVKYTDFNKYKHFNYVFDNYHYVGDIIRRLYSALRIPS